MSKIDIHAHYGNWPFAGKDSGLEDFENIAKKHNIEAIFVSSSKALMYNFIEGNEEIFNATKIKRFLYGYVVINANYPEESMEEIKKYLPHPKFIGVKYHPGYSKVPADSSQLNNIYQFLSDNEIPILIHTDGGAIPHPSRLVSVNKRFPELKIIAAHMGGAQYGLGIELSRNTNNNVYLEICSTNISHDKIRQAVDAAGIERVLFGTDYSLFDPSYTIGAVESSELDIREKEYIYKLNAIRIFKRSVNNAI